MKRYCTKCKKQLGNGSKYEVCVQCRETCPACGGYKDRSAKTCKQCQDITGEKNPNYRHGAAMGNRQSSRARFVWLLVHRGAACERCGYSDSTILVMHHKDCNRSNNALDNLEILCPNCHASEHAGKWRQGVPARLDAIHTALSAEPDHIILDEWMEGCPSQRKALVQCPGCGGTRVLFYHGYTKSSGFCNQCNQLRKAYGT